MASQISARSELGNQKFLQGVWDGIRKNTKKARRDLPVCGGVSVNYFEEHKKHYISKISHLIRSDSYDFSNLTPYFLEKGGGDFRVICVSPLRDRLVQRATLRLLNRRGYSFGNDASFGFLQGKSVQLACRRSCKLRAEKPWVVKTDISKFFDNIPRDILSEIIKRKVKISSVHPVLLKAVACEAKGFLRSDQKRLEKCGIRKGVGIRQGMPLAPYFSNLILYEFDLGVLRKGFSMVRYADDIAVFCSSEREACQALEYIRGSIGKLQLSIPGLREGAKTRIYNPSKDVEFLGVKISKDLGNGNCQIFLGEDQIVKMRQRIRQFGDLSYCKENDVRLLNYQKKIEAIIAGYEGAYDICINGEQVMDSLRDIAASSYRKLLREELGLDLNSLSEQQKFFLGMQ